MALPPVEFTDFDLSIYKTLPRLSPNASLRLADDLLRVAPTAASTRVRDAAGRVEAEFEILDRAIQDRRALASEAILKAEAEFDDFVDSLWHDLYVRLASWSTFERPGMGLFMVKDTAAVDYTRYTELARQAREITQMLFGSKGLDFVDRSYPEQAEAMARLLAAIDKYELADAITLLVGPDLLPILRDAQTRYLEMVRVRDEREQNVGGTSLRELATRMRWQIDLYVVHVLTLLDVDKPASQDVVRAGLQPILDFRQWLRPRSDGGDEHTFDGTLRRL